jgi:hypothetical protein
MLMLILFGYDVLGVVLEKVWAFISIDLRLDPYATNRLSKSPLIDIDTLVLPVICLNAWIILLLSR